MTLNFHVTKTAISPVFSRCSIISRLVFFVLILLGPH
nr:MAG TPA: hypothetical protein [Caudoviricetes sp.]